MEGLSTGRHWLSISAGSGSSGSSCCRRLAELRQPRSDWLRVTDPLAGARQGANPHLLRAQALGVAGWRAPPRRTRPSGNLIASEYEPAPSPRRGGSRPETRRPRGGRQRAPGVVPVWSRPYALAGANPQTSASLAGRSPRCPALRSQKADNVLAPTHPAVLPTAPRHG